MTDTQKLLTETAEARERAAELLASLRAAKRRSEENLQALGHSDAFKRVTGRSAMDNAIASAQRMVESLDRAAETIDREVQSDARQAG